MLIPAEMLCDIGAGRSTHLPAARGIGGEIGDGLGHAPWISRLDEDAAVCRLDDFADDSIDRQYSGAAGRHIVEYLVGISGSEHGNVAENSNAGIGGGKHGRHSTFGIGAGKGDVGELKLAGQLLEALALLAIADNENVDLRAVFEQVSRVQENIEVVGHSHGARISGDELAIETITRSKIGSAIGGVEHGCIDAIRNQADFAGLDALLDQVITIGRRIDEKAVGMTVEKCFKPSRRGNEEAVPQKADIDGELRPEITNLKQKRTAMQHGEYPGGHRLEDRRRCAHDEIGPAGARANNDRGRHEAEE